MTLDQGKVGQVYTVTRVGGQGAADGGCWTLAFCRERWWRSSGGAFGGPGGASAAGVYLDPPAG